MYIFLKLAVTRWNLGAKRCTTCRWKEDTMTAPRTDALEYLGGLRHVGVGNSFLILLTSSRRRPAHRPRHGLWAPGTWNRTIRNFARSCMSAISLLMAGSSNR